MTVVPIRELPEFVRNVTATLALERTNIKAVVLGLEGDLGSGKTTFVQQLARQMGIRESVVSPTYVLMKKYDLPQTLNPWGQKRRFKTLIHIDAYRLEFPEQFAQLKPETFMRDPSAIVVIEWFDKVADVLPEPDVLLKFSSEGVEETTRNIEMQK